MTRALSVCFASAVLVAMAGCGGGSSSVAPTTGQVTFKGSPVDGATVTMSREDGSLFATGVTDAQGNFEMTTKYGKKTFTGAPIGKVVVTITKFPNLGDTNANDDPDADPLAVDKMMEQMFNEYGEETGEGMNITVENELPEIYASQENSPLTETIDKDPTKNVFTFALDEE